MNLIPLAGEGKRFKGFDLPKPLIKIKGVPMISRVIRNMPKSDKWIFIVRDEHIKKYQIEKIIKKEVKNPIIISINKTTEGQASTCLLSEAYTKNEPIFISACDNIFFYDKKKFNKLKKKCDCIAFTFTKDELLRKNPYAWGWYGAEKNGDINKVSIKQPISDNPYLNHAVTGSFYLNNSKDFFNSIRIMINENFRVNDEFYLDSIPLFLRKIGKKTKIFDVNKFISWNKPSDL